MIASATCAVQENTSAVPAPYLSLERARQKFSELEQWVMSEEARGLTLAELEREQEQREREAQRLLLQAHVEARGMGDMGPALEVVRNDQGDIRLHTHKHDHQRHATTIFGEVRVNRIGYGAKGAKSIHPLDSELALPQRLYSYEIQRRGLKGAVQGPFDEAVERVQEATGVLLPKRSLEEVAKEAAVDFDKFYAERRTPEPEKTGPIVVAGVDAKGIPMVKPEKALRVVRRGKGKKANKKRMATVAAVFTQQPRVRTPEEVVESLFKTPLQIVAQDDRPRRSSRPTDKRVWASLIESKEEVINAVAAEMDRRDPKDTKKRVAVTDGEKALQKRIQKNLPGVVLILDLIHALEYLWKAGYVFHKERSKEAEEWVKERALRILRGEVGQVVKGIRKSATHARLKGKIRKTIDNATGYLYRNRHRTRYHEYLAEGLPIASGAVEGACKNLIKDRMERSGMRWTEEGAEAMVKLRATYVSGDFEEYWSYHVAEDQRRLHPPSQWRVPPGTVDEE